jgi:hypothetical protein
LSDLSSRLRDAIARDAGKVPPPPRTAEELEAEDAKSPEPEPEVDPTFFGPYYLLPSYRALAHCVGKQNHGNLDFNRVLLYADSGQFVAASNQRIMVSPVCELTDRGLEEPDSLNELDFDLGPCTFILPTKLFEVLPQELARGQSHLQLTIETDGKRWVAHVEESPLPNRKTSRSYVLEEGIYPDPFECKIPTAPGIAHMLALANEESSRIVTFDTDHLIRMCEAMGTRKVRVFTHGRTGVIRLEAASEDESSFDPFTQCSVGLLMPWHDWEQDAEHDLRKGYRH